MGGGTAGGARRPIASAGAETRFETVVAQQPQHILGDAGRGIADKAHPVRREIGETADRIVQGAVGLEIDCVDRKIAPRRIDRPIGVEGNARVAAVGLDIAAQGRDLEMLRRHHRGHGAVGEAGRHDLDAVFAEQLDHPLGRRRSGDVDVGPRARPGHRPAQQRIAHRSADKPRLDAARRERLEHGQGRRLGQPRRRRDPGHILGLRHQRALGSICAGTMRPFCQRGAT